MKRLLIVVAVLCAGVPAVFAADEHHPEQGGTPASRSAPEKEVQLSQPAAPGKAMSGTADAQMVKAQERMKQAQMLMSKLREAKDPAERKKLMREHTQALRDTMGMMRDMKMMCVMGSGQGMGRMGQGKGPQAQTGDMMPMHQMMEERMEMMQMMMEQMMQREEMRDTLPGK